MRRGFTLIELLVASGVFLFGFTAALGLFLIGTRARAQADGMLRLSLAASSIVEEIRLEAGREQSGAPYAPVDYVGDGFAAVATTDETLTGEDAILFPYTPQPGIWYRIIHVTDEKGDPADSLATALRVDLLVVWNPQPDPTLPAKELARRQRQNPPIDNAATPTDEYLEFLADFMAKRGFAVRETAWIIRKPSWER
jgi:prepilin-type N-terminal cleavage/methylation domain-containing protein